MNWKEINKKYPNAVDVLCDWLNIIKTPDAKKNIGLMQISELFHTTRRLYDFFDKEDIYISVYLKDYISHNVWWTDICAFGRPIALKTLNSRSAAEKQAFLKAFEILEEKLNS
jgi:hypothetical protein